MEKGAFRGGQSRRKETGVFALEDMLVMKNERLVELDELFGAAQVALLLGERRLFHVQGDGSAIDARTTQHPGYAISQRKRKRIEECFGWLKTIALLRKVRHRGIFKVGWVFTFAAAAYNLVRMRNLAIQAT